MTWRRRVLDALPEWVQSPIWRAVQLARLGHPFFDRELYHEEADRREFFRRAFKALSFNEIGGDYVEFGCWSAMTFALAHRESRAHGIERMLWAADSFAGLPPPSDPADDHPKWWPARHRSGAAAPRAPSAMSEPDFHRACRLRGIPRSAYRVIPGYYAESLRDADRDLPSDIALAYVDCDLYSSTRDVLRFLAPRLKHGMILAFDDYFCWSATQASGERKAMAEAFRDHPDWVLVPFVQFGWAGMSFVVERRYLLADARATDV